ncbi:MAG: hypothetical protein RTU30_14645 [Candidatus Thorarchaeota archaeon]
MPSRKLRRAYMLDPHPDFEVSWWSHVPIVIDGDANFTATAGNEG